MLRPNVRPESIQSSKCGLAIALMFFASVFGGACGASKAPSNMASGGANGAGGATSASALIGARGGVVSIPDHSLSVQIPPGALDGDLTITLTPIAPPIPGSVGQVYDIGPTGTQFKIPATLTFSYVDEELGGRSRDAFAVSTVVGDAWQAVSPPLLDPDARTITGTTTHLSPYALSAAAATVDSSADASEDGGVHDAGPDGVGDAGVDVCAATCNEACVDLENDNANCGRCGVACSANAPSTAQCFGGRCVTVLADLETATIITDLVVTGSTVAWIDVATNCYLYSVPTGGGSKTMLAQLNLAQACNCLVDTSSSLTSDGSSLYWGASGICSIPIAGGELTRLYSGTNIVRGLVVRSNGVYWMDNLDGLELFDFGTASAKPIASVGSDAPDDLFADASKFYWFAGAGAPQGYAISSAYSVPLAGTAATPLATGIPAVTSAALGSDGLYGIAGGKALGKVPLTGGATQTLYMPPSPTSTTLGGLAVDASSVYWGEWTNTTFAIRMMPLGGGAVTTLFSVLDNDTSGVQPVLASDNAFLYWAMWDSPSRGQVMKVALH